MFLSQKTHAHRKLEDNVPKPVKDERFKILYDLNRKIAAELNQEFLGSKQVVLIEKVNIS